MPVLDLRTILIEYICGNLICAIVLFTLWRQNRSRYSGLGFWMASFVFNLAGIALFAGRGGLPDFFSMFLGSVLLVGGTFLLYLGIERFLQNKGAPLYIYIMLVVYIILQIYFIYIQPNLEIRNILFSAVLMIFSFQFWLLFFRQIPLELRKITGILGIITTVFGLLALIRIVLNILIPAGTDLYQSIGYEAILYMAFQLMYIILTISLFNAVNRRLFFDLEKDISERNKIEDALKTSEEKFYKAFQASPDAILITRISDGQIIEINDRFVIATGYTKEEALGKTTIALGLWANPKDRDIIVSEMRVKSRLIDYHFDFRVKSGGILKGEFSSEYIKLGGEDYMLSIIQDITERQRVEDILHVRLALWEYSLSHTAVEVMEKALDEIEILTGSLISFYHLVEEDSNSLSLQAWSTRTKNDYCKAEGNGMHYSIDSAGVWVNCIRERKPVIHNDYASLPDKKGLPEGHAGMIRELVVPILHDNKIVAILGVGNKASDYTNQDAELVDYIADLVWMIVSQKRADDKIYKLNEKLEMLAMTDELTSLPNRRSFFLRGNEEVSRAQRYHTPLSIIMLDIDKFKSINDTYGHDMGDLALQCLARTLREQIREVDIPGRLGGEEFGILLPNTKLEDGFILAERIRKAVENLRFTKEVVPVTLTTSMGVAAFQTETNNLDELLHNADLAMYQAKEQGRNRVVMCK